MFKRFFLVAGMLALAGCAVTSQGGVTPVTSASGDSLALQVMKANGNWEGLRDAEIDLASETGSGLATDALNAVMLHEHLLGRATPMPGVPNAAMSAFFVLEFFNDRTYIMERGGWMPVWMPKSLASDPLDASLKMTAIIEEAFVNALPEGYRVKPYEWVDKAMIGSESNHRVLRVDGPLCEQWSCVVKGSLTSNERPSRSFSGRMVQVETPTFVQTGEEWSYSYSGLGGSVGLGKITEEYDEQGMISGHWHRIKTESLTDFDYGEFNRRFSAAMPEWAYMYVGPKDRFNHAEIPLVLNRGKELLFVKPTTQDAM